MAKENLAPQGSKMHIDLCSPMMLCCSVRVVARTPCAVSLPEPPAECLEEGEEACDDLDEL
eukprot:13449262-Alexandrium_andersonii.AAC.1